MGGAQALNPKNLDGRTLVNIDFRGRGNSNKMIGRFLMDLMSVPDM